MGQGVRKRGLRRTAGAACSSSVLPLPEEGTASRPTINWLSPGQLRPHPAERTSEAASWCDSSPTKCDAEKEAGLI
ncbi:hypothetical protein Emed_001247 [Eimeria media]